MAYGALIGAAVGGALNYFGGRAQSDAAGEAASAQIDNLKKAAKALNKDFDNIIEFVRGNTGDVAGRKVQPAQYDPISIRESQQTAIGSNSSNLADILGLVGQTNQATIQNDLQRVNQLFPDFQQTLGNLSSSAASLSAGQLPFDRIQDIVSGRQTSAGNLGIPGGAGPASLRDLGLSSLDATNQGQSLFQSILQAADQFVSPVSRQTAAPQFFVSPQESTNLDLQQAQLGQQSEQNFNNLKAQPDPGQNLLLQLMLQQATSVAGARSQVAGLGQPVGLTNGANFAQSFAGPLASGIQSFFDGNNGGGLSSGFGSFSSQPQQQQQLQYDPFGNRNY